MIKILVLLYTTNISTYEAYTLTHKYLNLYVYILKYPIKFSQIIMIYKISLLFKI